MSSDPITAAALGLVHEGLLCLEVRDGQPILYLPRPNNPSDRLEDTPGRWLRLKGSTDGLEFV